MDEVLVLRLVKLQKLNRQAKLAATCCDQNTLNKCLFETGLELDVILCDEELEESFLDQMRKSHDARTNMVRNTV